MGVMDTVGKAAKGFLGVAEKAVLIIGDSEDYKVELANSEKPQAGAKAGGLGPKNIGKFDTSAAKGFKRMAKGFNLEQEDEDFTDAGDIKSYRFEVQFNPDEITINGYGGEELPIQNYANRRDPSETAKNDEVKKDMKKGIPGSHMAAADTRIDMNFKVVFDRTDPQDAFFSDKFTLSQSSLVKGAVNVGLSAAGVKKTSVQPEVEALNAVVRDPNKRLCMFIWGDMKYEGLLNSVNAEYTMFNVNGEPCRAVVSINMVLYDQAELGRNIKTIKNMYSKYVHAPGPSMASSVGAIIGNGN